MKQSKNYEYILSHHFLIQLKKLLKNNESLRGKVISALQNFKKQTAISLGKSLFKVRIPGRGKGKSRGYRMYLLVYEADGILIPVTIFSKSKMQDLPYRILKKHMDVTKKDILRR